MILLKEDDKCYIYLKESIDSKEIKVYEVVFLNYTNKKKTYARFYHKGRYIYSRGVLNDIYENKLLMHERNDELAKELFSQYLTKRIHETEFLVERLKVQKELLDDGSIVFTEVPNRNIIE